MDTQVVNSRNDNQRTRNATHDEEEEMTYEEEFERAEHEYYSRKQKALPMRCMKCLADYDEEGHCNCCPKCGGPLDQNLTCRGECLVEKADRLYDEMRDRRG